MAKKTLAQINKELGSVYNPYVKNIKAQQALIPEQIKTETAGLEAKQTQAFGDILGGARRRGLGFSGIPIEEQARYTSTEFLPSLARLQQSGNQNRLSLEEAILGVQERRAGQAQSIYENYLNRRLQNKQLAEQKRQADINAALQREQMRLSKSSAGGGGGFSPSFGGATLGASSKPKPAGKTSALQQTAFDDVYTRVNSVNDAALKSDYVATASSAKYGNQKDRFKLQIYRQLRPDLFKFAYSWEK